MYTAPSTNYRSYYILPKAPTRPTLSYTGHIMKQANLIKREQTGQSLRRWFSPGTSASSTAKTGRHDIAEILLCLMINFKPEEYTKCIRHIGNSHKNYKLHRFFLQI
jgi:hypothetical protein